MNKTFFQRPLVALLTVLFALAIVGVAAAVVPVTITVSSPTPGELTGTAVPALSVTATGSPSPPVTLTCSVSSTTGSLLTPDSECASSPTIPGGPFPDGSYQLIVKAEDSQQPTPATPAVIVPFSVNATPPTITITAPASGGSYGDFTPNIAFSVDNAISVECAFDGGAFQSCSSNFAAPELAPGSHTFTVRATSQTGHSATSSVAFTIDSDLPLDNPEDAVAIDLTVGKHKIRHKRLYEPVAVAVLPSPSAGTRACRGRVRASIKPKVHRAKTYRKSFKLKTRGSKCVAKGTIKLPKKYTRKRATVKASYGGNDFLASFKISKSIRKL